MSVCRTSSPVLTLEVVCLEGVSQTIIPVLVMPFCPASQPGTTNFDINRKGQSRGDRLYISAPSEDSSLTN